MDIMVSALASGLKMGSLAGYSKQVPATFDLSSAICRNSTRSLVRTHQWSFAHFDWNGDPTLAGSGAVVSY
ncbi:hypothetical protein WKW80_23390 [Variovorax humicola]|uniref:Uncharacterized protein n=1 Tax=Variovorax humicola TaxID=1769758 RepID=A0ABU8W4F6_9BURK